MAEKKRYTDLPYKEWDGKSPLALYDSDTYFFCLDDIKDFAELHDCLPEQLRLVTTQPLFGSPIYYENLWGQEIPEGRSLEDFWPELSNAVDEVNRLIENRKEPWSWVPENFRTSILNKEKV